MTSSEERTSAQSESRRLPHRDVAGGLLRPPLHIGDEAIHQCPRADSRQDGCAVCDRVVSGPIATPRQSNPVVPLISRADATQVMPPAFVAGWLCNDTIAVCSARLSGLDSTASASRNLAAKSCAMGPAVVASVSLCDHRAWKSKHCSMPFVVPFSG